MKDKELLKIQINKEVELVCVLELRVAYFSRNSLCVGSVTNMVGIFCTSSAIVCIHKGGFAILLSVSRIKQYTQNFTHPTVSGASTSCY